MMEMNYQPYPEAGRLASNMNQTLNALRARIDPGQAEVYCYVVATIKNRDGYFYQTGSAPNFQGDLITLCTCKHFMRTFMDAEEWRGKWVAGFSSVIAGNGHNALVYLMRVNHTFESHLGFWFSKEISDETKRAKLAHISKFGDLYQPKSQYGDPFDIQNYVCPIEAHVHTANNCWHKDIAYEGCRGRKATLVTGDIGYSFLWDKPMIIYEGRLHRGQKKVYLHALFEELNRYAL